MNPEINPLPNIALIDGQNLHLGTTEREQPWGIDHVKFRTYLREKYKIGEAYYFLGFISPNEQDLYDNLQKAGFILNFKEHPVNLKSEKKGNIDCEIIFSVLKKIIENEPFEKAFIVSGDGDYKKLVDFLIKKNRFGKMLFPNKGYASSLYELLGGQYYDFLDSTDVRAKIEYINAYQKKKAP